VNEAWLALLHALTGRLLGDRSLRGDPAPLVEELVAEGFDAADVMLALAWVERFFAGSAGPAEAEAPTASQGCRTRSAEELVCVTPAAFGYLLRLERAGVIDAGEREEILERALAACRDEVGEEEIREISRLVLEGRGRDGDAAGADDARGRGRTLN